MTGQIGETGPRRLRIVPVRPLRPETRNTKRKALAFEKLHLNQQRTGWIAFGHHAMVKPWTSTE